MWETVFLFASWNYNAFFPNLPLRGNRWLQLHQENWKEVLPTKMPRAKGHLVVCKNKQTNKNPKRKREKERRNPSPFHKPIPESCISDLSLTGSRFPRSHMDTWRDVCIHQGPWPTTCLHPPLPFPSFLLSSEALPESESSTAKRTNCFWT